MVDATGFDPTGSRSITHNAEAADTALVLDQRLPFCYGQRVPTSIGEVMTALLSVRRFETRRWRTDCFALSR
jgi:hypothetical protein